CERVPARLSVNTIDVDKIGIGSLNGWHRRYSCNGWLGKCLWGGVADRIPERDSALPLASCGDVEMREQLIPDAPVVLIRAPAGGIPVASKCSGAGLPQGVTDRGRTRCGNDGVVGAGGDGAAEAQSASIEPLGALKRAAIVDLPAGADE